MSSSYDTRKSSECSWLWQPLIIVKKSLRHIWKCTSAYNTLGVKEFLKSDSSFYTNCFYIAFTFHGRKKPLYHQLTQIMKTDCPGLFFSFSTLSIKKHWRKKNKYFFNQSFMQDIKNYLHQNILRTPPIAETLCVKKGRAIVVFGIFMK